MSDSTPAVKHNIIVGWTGALLVRLFVPAWILTGAITKVLDATPKSLPRSILDAGGLVGFKDHFLLLAILTGIEFFFIGIMLFVPKFARLAASVILAIFLVVLSVEMFGYGNFESCGCFGEKSLAPTTMFAIDLGLLLGIIFLKPRKSKCGLNKGNRSLIGASTFILLAWFFTFNSIMNRTNTESTLPRSWYPQNLENWSGKSVDDIDLFSWVKEWPRDIHDGKQYVVFYSLTCDHCEALFYAFFEFPEFPTTLVAIPESTDGFNYDGAFVNPCYECDKTELQVGPDWIVGTPLVVAIENGIVKCAIENEDSEAPSCLIW